MSENEPPQLDFAKLAAITLVGVFILGASVYAAFRYSQSQSGNIILPGGVTYLGPTKTKQEITSAPLEPSPTPVRFTASNDTVWDTYIGTNNPYSFLYPSTLPLVMFQGDVSDSVAISWGGLPPEQNVLLNIEFIDQRDPKFVNLPKIQYVENWHQFFSGLKDTKNVEPFVNSEGLKGYRAYYLDFSDETPNVNIFFEVPENPNIMIHLANGILDPEIFDKVVDTIAWNKTSPTSVISPTLPPQQSE